MTTASDSKGPWYEISDGGERTCKKHEQMRGAEVVDFQPWSPRICWSQTPRQAPKRILWMPSWVACSERETLLEPDY